MRRALVLSVVVAVAATLPAAAGAAGWKGVVVAKDASRKAIVTASRGGVMRTVRAAGAFKAIHLGQRVAVQARPLADGTFAGAKVRALGRASHARIHAVVVRHRSSRAILSAGGTVFTVRVVTPRRQAAAAGSLEPGDEIVADVSIGAGKLETQDVDEVGHAELVELEGQFGGLANGVLDLLVGGAVVQVTVPAELTLPPLDEGAEISLLVSVGADGGFTLTYVQDDEGDGSGGGADLDESSGAVEAEGTFVGFDATAGTVTVQPGGGATPITCEVPAGMDVSAFVSGQAAEIRCVPENGKLVLARIEADGQVAEAGGDDPGDVEDDPADETEPAEDGGSDDESEPEDDGGSGEGDEAEPEDGGETDAETGGDTGTGGGETGGGGD